MKTISYLVKELIELKQNLIKFILQPREAIYLNYLAGQYLEILYPDSSFQPFSIANAPYLNGQLELHIRCLANDLATQAMLKQAQQSNTISLRGPFGKAFYRSLPDKPVILLAGGTGFAYAKAIIEQAVALQDFRKFHLFWGAKTPSDFYMPELLVDWKKNLKNFDYTLVVSQPQSANAWSGKMGYIPDAVLHDYPHLKNFQVYASGPFGMVKTAYELFLKNGLQRELMFSDML